MEKIKPAFTDNVVPICFSADDNYAFMLAAEIRSIIAYSSKNYNYDIVILIKQMSNENKFHILSLVARHINFSIRFVDVSHYIFGYKFYTDSIITKTKYTNEIYFRVLAPTIMENYNYVIFLDADMVVLDDLAHLIKLASPEHLITGVRDYEGIASCYNNNYERTKYRINELNIKDFDKYFIAGILIMNIKMFNEKFTSKELLNLAVSKNWKQYDQDLLNYLCNGSVQIIDASWNFVEDINNTYHKLPKNLFEEYLESEKNPKIIHYSGRRKPWKRNNSKYSEYFYKYLAETAYKTFIPTLKSK